VLTFVPPTVPAELRDQVAELVERPSNFCRLHRVQDKDSKAEIPFDPLPMQRKIFDAVEAGHNRILVIKARQVAATTACKFVLHQKWTATETESMFALVSLRAESATALLDDNRRWLRHPPDLLRRELDTRAKGELKYADTGASLKAFTSRSQTGLRSFSPAGVLLSEFAFAPDQEELLSQALAAVGDGLLMIESTANNPGDAFSRLIAGAPENGWHVLTHWWHEHPAYCDQVGDDFEVREDEAELVERYGLSTGQVSWRRRYRATLGEFKFKREYPSCLDDCFLNREGGWFDDELLQGIHVIDHTAVGASGGREIEAPHAHDRYVMGVDVGGGVGGDYSALCVVSVATRQPVFAQRSNRATPSQWAHTVIQVASRYNNALVLAESNNHGHALLLEMDNCGYRQQWRNPQGRPWTTTLQSKLEAFDTLREAMQQVQVVDRATWLELRALTVAPGKVAPEAPQGSHDDAAVAIALAYRCLRDIPATWRTVALQSQRTRMDDLIKRSRARRLRASSLPF
jgi:hypothetical protein